jgi:hypothetical protein
LAALALPADSSHICSVAYPVLDAVDKTVTSEIAESDPIALIGPKQRKI